MKKLFTLFILLIALLQLHAQQFEWAGTFLNASMADVFPDHSENVFIVGGIGSTNDFDFGSGTNNLSPANGKLYFAKYDKNSNLIWIKQTSFASTIGIRACTVDKQNNLIICGNFNGISDFDPSASTAQLSSTGGSDMFIAKYDGSTGNFIWAKRVGGNASNSGAEVKDITIDGSNNLIVSGKVTQTVDFDPGTGVDTLSGSDSHFLAKYNSSGNLVWAKVFQGSNMGMALNTINPVRVDKWNNVVTAGIFETPFDFDPGPNQYILTPTIVYEDVYVAKLDSNGNFVWAKMIKGPSYENVGGLACDTNGNVVVSGEFSIQTDFDPDSTQTHFLYSINTSSFVCKLSVTGQLMWAKAFDCINNGGNTGNFNEAFAMDIDKFNNVYTTGTFLGTVDFNPDNAIAYPLTNSFARSIYLTKLDDNGNFVWVKNTGSNTCSPKSLSVDDYQNIYTNGYYFGIFDVDFDTAMVTNLNPTNLGGQRDFFCKLSQCKASSSSLTVNACAQYNFNGQLLTTSGTYYDTISNTSGCDSLMTLHLNIIPISSTVSQSGIVLTCVTPGVSYQWVSCPSYSPISGATAPSFTPDANGQFACITSNGGCFDTSACATVNGVGITDVKDVITISCFPNPAFDILNLQSSVDLGRTRLSITTATGVVIKEVHHKLGTTCRIDVSSLASGIYFIEVANGDKKYRKKFVKN